MISGILLILLLASFAVLWAWAWSERRRQGFSEAALLPLHEDDTAGVGKS